MNRYNKDMGDLGEAIVCNYLKSKGFVIVETKYRGKGGEIDIIARNGNKWHFVEVKYRTTTNFGSGREAVGYTKQRTIHRIAQIYLLYKKLWGNVEISFDVAEVSGIPPNTKVEYLESCF